MLKLKDSGRGYNRHYSDLSSTNIWAVYMYEYSIYIYIIWSESFTCILLNY